MPVPSATVTDEPPGDDTGQPEGHFPDGAHEATPGPPAAPSDYLTTTAAVFDMTPGATTTLPARPHRRTGRSLVVALAAVLGLLLAGGTFTAVHLLSGGDDDPAEAAPASTFALLQVDLDPSASQKVGIYRFSKRFPKSPTASKGDSGSVMDTLLTEIVDSSDTGVSYKHDIKPWLGKSAAFAAYETGDHRVKPIAILGYKDKAKAEAALKKATADSDSGYAFGEKWVVLAPTMDDAKAAVAAAAKSSLAGAGGHYADDVDALRGHPVATAWADIGAAFPLLYSQFGGLLRRFPGFGDLSGAAGRPSEACIAELSELKPSAGKDPYAGLSAACRAELFGTNPTLTPKSPEPLPSLDPSLQPRGRIALGLSVNDDVAQLQAKSFGNDTKSAQLTGSKDAARYIRQMPAGTSVGVATGDLRPGVKALFDVLSKSSFSKEFTDGIDEAERQTGLSFPDDVLTVLGDSAAVAYDKKTDQIGVRTHPENAGKAKSVLDKLASLAADGGDPFEVQTEGRDVTLSTDADYAKALTGSGGLTSTDLFRKAIGGLPSAPQVVAFANLEQLLQGLDSETADHFRAVGLVVDGASDNPSLVIRLVVR
ncbi:MAG: hypothetical protein QOE64_195 [Frankiales bacterium]|nr:hypothetical protein [Frankiales bacterium]